MADRSRENPRKPLFPAAPQSETHFRHTSPLEWRRIRRRTTMRREFSACTGKSRQSADSHDFSAAHWEVAALTQPN